jgi:hypothetical protein
MRLLGHFLTFLIAVTVLATGGYYFLQQRYVKQLEVEKLRKSLLSMENEIKELRQNLLHQQEVIKHNSTQVNRQLTSQIKDIETLASNLDGWQESNINELKKIKDTMTSFQKENKAELASLSKRTQINLQNLLEKTKAEIHEASKDHLKIIRSLQNQIIMLTDRHIEKNQFPELFNTELKTFFTRYKSVNGDLGSLPSGRPGEIIKNIPDSIPDEAQEILIYAYVSTNYVRGGRYNFKISVKLSESKEAAFYLYAIANTQQEWSYNSDNFWLPMPANRKIFLTTTGSPLFGSWESHVKIIAYR